VKAEWRPLLLGKHDSTLITQL